MEYKDQDYNSIAIFEIDQVGVYSNGRDFVRSIVNVVYFSCYVKVKFHFI